MHTTALRCPTPLGVGHYASRRKWVGRLLA
nr:MAG TPA: hypothetical protein [Caudoviricetes sp.]